MCQFINHNNVYGIQSSCSYHEREKYNIPTYPLIQTAHPVQFQNYPNFMEFSKLTIIINIFLNPWYGIF